MGWIWTCHVRHGGSHQYQYRAVDAGGSQRQILCAPQDTENNMPANRSGNEEMIAYLLQLRSRLGRKGSVFALHNPTLKRKWLTHFYPSDIFGIVIRDVLPTNESGLSWRWCRIKGLFNRCKPFKSFKAFIPQRFEQLGQFELLQNNNKRLS